MTATLTGRRPSVPMRVTHAPRWAIQESSLGIPHEEVAIETEDGRELPDAGHTGGLRTHRAAYEQRTTTFLDRAHGLKETP
jgi:hypothetical protein